MLIVLIAKKKNSDSGFGLDILELYIILNCSSLVTSEVEFFTVQSPLNFLLVVHRVCSVFLSAS